MALKTKYLIFMFSFSRNTKGVQSTAQANLAKQRALKYIARNQNIPKNVNTEENEQFKNNTADYKKSYYLE